MKKYIAALAFLALSSCTAYAASTYQPYQTFNPYANSNNQTLKGSVVMVPAGSEFSAVTSSELNSKYLLLGQSVSVMLAQDYYYSNKLVAPIGSVVNGTVISVKKGTIGGINGHFQIKFTNIVTPYGQMIPISGQLKTDDGTGVLSGATAMDTAKEYAKDVAVGAASGALSGVILGSISGGSVKKSTIAGTAIGGGLGLGKSVSEKGEDAVIPANRNISILLDQPITLNSSQSYQY